MKMLQAQGTVKAAMQQLTFLKVLILGTILFLGACSSHKLKDESSNLAPAGQDAGTDAVPPAAPLDSPAASTPSNGTPPSQSPSPSETVSNPNPQQTPDPLPNNGEASAAPVPSSSSVAPSNSSPSPNSNSNSGSGIVNYSVKKGDTLMKIAFENYGDFYKWKEVYEANKDVIKDPNHIPVGLVIKVENSGSNSIEKNGEPYLIKMGDTLRKISNELYGTETKWKELWQNNKKLIRNPNKIFAGFYIYYFPASEKSANVANQAAAAQSAEMKPAQENNMSGSKEANPSMSQGAPPSLSSQVQSLSAGSANLPNSAGGIMGGAESAGVNSPGPSQGSAAGAPSR